MEVKAFIRQTDAQSELADVTGLGICMQSSPWAHVWVKTKKGGREGRETQGLCFLHFSSRKKKGKKSCFAASEEEFAGSIV